MSIPIPPPPQEPRPTLASLREEAGDALGEEELKDRRERPARATGGRGERAAKNGSQRPPLPQNRDSGWPGTKKKSCLREPPPQKNGPKQEAFEEPKKSVQKAGEGWFLSLVQHEFGTRTGSFIVGVIVNLCSSVLQDSYACKSPQAFKPGNQGPLSDSQVPAARFL